jgi:hypothetical protein
MNIDPNKKDEAEKRLATLCQFMGHALWESQGLEQILAKYYSVAFKLPSQPTPEQIESEFESNFSHTAGTLVKLLKQAAGEREIFAGRLESFVKERNWLAHKLRRTDIYSLLSEAEFNSLVARVSSITDEAIQLTEAVNKLMIDHFVSLGVPRANVESALEEERAKLYGS